MGHMRQSMMLREIITFESLHSHLQTCQARRRVVDKGMVHRLEGSLVEELLKHDGTEGNLRGTCRMDIQGGMN